MKLFDKVKGKVREMNILYISELEGGKYTGPRYSVPNRIKAQAEFDNVYWINLSDIQGEKIDSNLYHYISWKKFDLALLPSPFNRPDLVVFEEFFKIGCCLVAKKIERNNIPYVIVPRCQMTIDYLKNKKVKKKIANFLLFKHFSENSLAVQYLTEQEKEDSEIYYSGRSFIAPNGIISNNEQAALEKKPITGVFIGRYSIWQKGIDLLFSAIMRKKEILEKYNIRFELYGPDERTGSSQDVKKMAIENGIDKIVSINGPVFDNEKKEVLLNASFFIHTSRFEGMPMSVLEALSYGIPCLVTQGSNMREDVCRFNAGWGADNNVESIERAFIKICDSLSELKIKGENAKKLASEYSWSSISQNCHDIFYKLIKN